MISILTMDDLNMLAITLDIAVSSHLMTIEHAKSIWKNALKKTQLEPVFEKRVGEKGEVK